MKSSQLKLDMSGPSWLQTLVGVLLIVAIYIVQTGLTFDVEYRWARVKSVQPIAGQDSYHRAVVIETPERDRLVRTSDLLLQFQAGDYVCASKRTRLGRRWIRYGIDLPGYCRGLPHPERGQPELYLDVRDPIPLQNTKNGHNSLPYSEAIRLP